MALERAWLHTLATRLPWKTTIPLHFFLPMHSNRLSLSFETKGENAQVKPWRWGHFLFLAPSATSIFSQQYYRLYTRVMVQLEAILIDSARSGTLFAHSNGCGSGQRESAVKQHSRISHQTSSKAEHQVAAAEEVIDENAA